MLILFMLAGCTYQAQEKPAPPPPVSAPGSNEPILSGDPKPPEPAAREEAGKPANPPAKISGPVTPPKSEEGGLVIISENPVFTDSKRIMEELDKEIIELLEILGSMEDLSENDLSF